MVHYTEQWRELVREAHRMTPKPVGAPALTRRIGVWRRFSGETYDEFLSEVNDALRAVAMKIGLAEDHFKEWELSAYSAAAEGSNKSAVTYFEFPFGYDGYVMRMTATSHEEHVALSFSFDLSKPDLTGLHRFVPNSDAMKADNLKDALAALKAMLDKLIRQDSDETKTLEGIQLLLFERFWDSVDEALQLGRPFTEPGAKSQIFIDMRGLILSVGEEDHFAAIREGHPNAPAGECALFDEQSNLAAIRRMRPLIKAKHVFLHDLEIVQCNMMRRRTVFISTLGDSTRNPALKDGADFSVDEELNRPLRFLLLVNGFDHAQRGASGKPPPGRWEIGRLVFRLNELATVRLLGIRDLVSIRKGGSSLLELGGRLDGIYAAQAPAITATGPAPEQGRAEILAFMQQLNDLNRGEGGTGASGGLSYRINRSRQLFFTFRRLIEELEIDRIEGWQTYAELVQRGIYATFEGIDRIGLRMDGLFKRANVLLSILDATQSLELGRQQADINRLQSEQLRRMDDVLRDMRTLQHAAEAVALVAFAYYAGDIILEGLGAVGWLIDWLPFLPALPRWPPELNFEHLFKFGAGALVYLFFRDRIAKLVNAITKAINRRTGSENFSR